LSVPHQNLGVQFRQSKFFRPQAKKNNRFGGAIEIPQRQRGNQFLALPSNLIGSKDPDALEIPARRAEYSLTESASSPVQAEPAQNPCALSIFVIPTGAEKMASGAESLP